MQTLQRGFDVAKETLVPLEIAPVEFTHPIAVVVESGQWNITFRHAVDKGIDGGFIVLGGERSSQPQTVTPCGHLSRTTNEPSVALENLLGGGPIDDAKVNGLAGHGELHGFGVFGTDLEGDVAAVIDQHPITIGGHIERNVLVSLFGGGAAVFVPDIHHLAVLDVCAETLTQTVHIFAYRQVQLHGGEHFGLVMGGAVHAHTEFSDWLGGDVRPGTKLEPGQRLAFGFGEHLAVPIKEGKVPRRALDDLRREPAGGQRNISSIDADFAVAIAVSPDGHVIPTAGFVGVERKSGVFDGTLPVFGTHTDHAFCRRGDVYVERGGIQRRCSIANLGGRRKHVQPLMFGVGGQFVCFTRIDGIDAISQHPIAVGKFHRRLLRSSMSVFLQRALRMVAMQGIPINATNAAMRNTGRYVPITA